MTENNPHTDPLSNPLAKYFEADAAPATDPAFRLEVMERMARKRLYTEMAKNAATAFMLILSFMLAWPALRGALDAPGASTMATVSILTIIGIVAFAGHWLTTHRWNLRMLLPR